MRRPESLFTRTWGAGPPVVFIHGLGASSHYWDGVRERAPVGYEGIAIDLLGFGRSPKPPSASYDVDCHLDTLERHIPPESLLVGHSLGAILALALAARRPQLPRALVLVGTPAFADIETAQRDIGRLGLLPRLTVRGAWAARALCELMCIARPLAIAVAPVVLRDIPREVAADGARHTWRSYSRTLCRVVVEHRIMEDLTRTTAPVHFIHGRSDREAALEHVEMIAAHGPHAEVVAVDGDHHLALRRPEVLVPFLYDSLT
jgi:pimeloyl-ACP methyl ester carboxylesterase